MKSKYPDFNVLDEQDQWDEHTKDVVLKRVQQPSQRLVFFNPTEAAMLAVVMGELLDEQRTEIISYVVTRYDEKLYSAIGEGDREEYLPAEGELIRSGLKALDMAARVLYGHDVVELAREVRARMLRDLEAGTISADMKGSVKLQPMMFKTMLISATKAYYSHPTVWSEIGYAGPAYPRGYVRSEFGLVDPWEAKRSV